MTYPCRKDYETWEEFEEALEEYEVYAEYKYDEAKDDALLEAFCVTEKGK